MGDCMTFPDTVEEFMEEYKIVDTEHVYTNGAEMVSIFRMKQWFEHLPSAQPEPDIIACGDCKHYICHDRRCGYWNHGVKPLEWCCHAERREEGDA